MERAKKHHGAELEGTDSFGPGFYRKQVWFVGLLSFSIPVGLVKSATRKPL